MIKNGRKRDDEAYALSLLRRVQNERLAEQASPDYDWEAEARRMQQMTRQNMAAYEQQRAQEQERQRQQAERYQAAMTHEYNMRFNPSYRAVLNNAAAGSPDTGAFASRRQQTNRILNPSTGVPFSNLLKSRQTEHVRNQSSGVPNSMVYNQSDRDQTMTVGRWNKQQETRDKMVEKIKNDPELEALYQQYMNAADIYNTTAGDGQRVNRNRDLSTLEGLQNDINLAQYDEKGRAGEEMSRLYSSLRARGIDPEIVQNPYKTAVRTQQEDFEYAQSYLDQLQGKDKDLFDDWMEKRGQKKTAIRAGIDVYATGHEEAKARQRFQSATGATDEELARYAQYYDTLQDKGNREQMQAGIQKSVGHVDALREELMDSLSGGDQMIVNAYLSDPKANGGRLSELSDNGRERFQEFLGKYQDAAMTDYRYGAGLSLASIPMSLVGGFGSVIENAKRPFYADPSSPINTNAGGFLLTNLESDIQQGVSERIGRATTNPIFNKGAQFLYNAGMSTAKSLTAAMTGNAIVGSLGLTGTAAKVVGNLVTLPSFGANAYASTLQEGLARGLTEEQAQQLAFVSGLAEMGTEVISLDKVWDIMNGTGKKAAKSFIMDSLVQAGIEGSEEGASSIINRIADDLIAKDQSKYNQAVQGYIAQGMSPDEARSRASMDFWQEVFEEVLAGAVSGAFSATGANITRYADVARSSKDFADYTAKDWTEYAEAVDLDPDSYSTENQLERAQYLKEMAQENATKVEAGQKLSSKELRDFYVQAQETVANASEKQEEDQRQGQSRSIEVTPSEPQETVRTFTARDVPKEYSSTSNITANEVAQKLSSATSVREVVAAIREGENSTNAEARQLAQDMGGMQVERVIRQSENPLAARAEYRAAMEETSEQDAFLLGANGQEAPAGLSAKAQIAYNKGTMKRIEAVNAQALDSNTDISSAPVTIDGGKNSTFTGEIEQVGRDAQVVTKDGTVAFTNLRFNDPAMENLVRGAVEQPTVGAANLFLNLYPNGSPINNYRNGFKRMYLAGVTGVQTFEDAMSRAGSLRQWLPEDVLRQIYDEGVRDRETTQQDKAEKQTRPVARKGEGKVSYRVKNETSSDNQVLFRALAESTGLNVKADDQLNQDINGQFKRAVSELILKPDSRRAFSTSFHEQSEFIEAWAASGMAEVQQDIISFAIENFPEDFAKLVNAYQSKYADVEGTKSMSDAIAEFCNDAISGVFTTNKGMRDYAKFLLDHHTEQEARGIVQKIADFFQRIVNALRNMLKSSELPDAARMLARMDIDRAAALRQKWLSAMDKAIENYQNAEIQIQEEARIRDSADVSENVNTFGLGKYSEKQLNNWKSSKRIVFATSDSDVRSFVDDSLRDIIRGKKLYLGMVPNDVADTILSKYGVDVHGFNCSLGSYEIIKIMKDHGEEAKESPRGQRAVTLDDYLDIPYTFAHPDSIEPGVLYMGKPSFVFKKGSVRLVGVVSDKRLDVFTQTMYLNKKKSLATPTNEPASVNTPEASSGTALVENNLPQTTAESNTETAIQQAFAENDDIRRSVEVKDKTTLDFLENQKHVKTYRTFQQIGDGLYAPMNAMENGKLGYKSRIGVWEQATEDPSKVKDGRFPLKAGGFTSSGKARTTWAAYNPYLHSSNLVFNDQFAGAYDRPNLVVVECEVPVSEETSGYQADQAKDPVGWLEWKSGSVANALKKKGVERKVMLSRWMKPVRILSNAEVAQIYKDTLDGTDIVVPWNVVSPPLRTELEKLGVNIDYGYSKQVKASFEDKFPGVQPAQAVEARSSVKIDSSGRELTEGQREYFKNVSPLLKDENGALKRYYHGTARMDRVGTVFDPARATSGPMAFFTDNPQIAENYSRDKADTSLAYENEDPNNYYNQFVVDVDGEEMNLLSYWNTLSSAEKETFRERAGHITQDEDYENFIIDDSVTNGNGGYASDPYLVRQARGNAFRMLEDAWLQSGDLFNEEERFLDVMKLLGVEGVRYKDPNYRDEGVYEVYLNITNPLDTSTIDEDFAADVEDWLDNTDLDYYSKESANADMWDKNNVDPYDWLDRLRSDIENHTTHAWTSIPDVITDFLREQGYDGIVDQGGKNTGYGHQVVVPFSSEQIKNIDNENPTEDPDIRYSVVVDPILADTLSPVEKRRFEGMLKSKAFQRAANGDKIFAIDNKLIYTDANYANPGISQIIEIGSDYEDIIDFIREDIYEIEKRHGSRAGQYVEAYAHAQGGMVIRRASDPNGRRNERYDKYTKRGLQRSNALHYNFGPNEARKNSKRSGLSITAEAWDKRQGVKNSLVIKSDVRNGLEMEDWEKDLFEGADEFSVDASGREQTVSYRQESLDTVTSILSEGAAALAGQEVNRAQVRKIAKDLRGAYNSKVDLNTFSDNIAKVFAYMQESGEVDYRDVVSLMSEVALPVIEQSRQTVGSMDDFKAFRDRVRSYTIALNDEQKAEVKGQYGTLTAFRNATGLRISDKGQSLDSLWGEIADASYGLLDPYESSGNQPLAIADAMEALRPVQRNQWGANNEDAAYDLALQIVQRYYETAAMDKANAKAKAQIAKTAARLKEQNAAYRKKVQARYQQRLKDARAALKDHYEERIRNIRNQKNTRTAEQLADLRARFRQSKAETAERRQAHEEREKISKQVKELHSWLQNPTDEHHVPTALQGPVASFLSAFDFVMPEIRQYKTGPNAGKYGAALFDHMEGDHAVYRHIVADTRAEAERLVQEAFVQQQAAGTGSAARQSWRERMQGLNALMSKAFKGEETGLEDLAQMLDPELADNMVEFLNRNQGVISVAMLGADDLRFLHRVLLNLRTIINQGNKLYMQGRYETVSQMAESTIEELGKRRERMAMTKLGNTIRYFMNTSMITPSTYFYLLGDGAQQVYKGLRNAWDVRTNDIKEIEEYTRGKNGILKGVDVTKWSGEGAKIITFKTESGHTLRLTTAMVMSLYELAKRPDAVRHFVGGFKAGNLEIKRRVIEQNEPVHLTGKEITALTDMLTDEQKRVADGLQKFLAERCAEWNNEVSEKLYGYQKFTDPHYFPITVDRNTIAANDVNMRTDTLNAFTTQGYMHAVNPSANNALVLRDIFEVFVDHAVGSASTHGFALATNDAFRWYNYKNTFTDPQTGNVKRATTQQSIHRVGGNDWKQYFIGFMRDLGGQVSPQHGDLKGLSWLLGKYKAAAVIANSRVAAQQPMAYVRAAAVMNPKYLMRAMTSLAHPLKNAKYAQEHNSTAYWKSKGYYETYMGQTEEQIITGKASLLDKIRDKAGILAQLADDITWGVLYRAVEYEQMAQHRDMDPDGKEFRQLVNERFDDVIDQTQVVDSVMQRSQIMRNPNAKLFTGFMAEPTKTYNMVLRALWSADRNDISGSAKRISRSITVYLLNAIATAAAAGLIDSFRDDDDETEWYKRFLAALKENTADNINPLNLFPVVKDIWPIITSTKYGNTTSRMDLEGITNAIKAVQEIGKYFQGESKLTKYGLFKTIARGLSQVTGMPVYGALREVESIHNAFGENWKMKIPTMADQRRETYKDLYHAVNKDGDAMAEIGKLMQDGYTLKDIEKAIQSEYKSDYVDMTVDDPKAAAEMRKQLVKIYGTLGKEDPDAVVDGWIKEESVAYADLDTAMREGGDVSGIIKTLQDEGKHQDDIRDHIKGQYAEDLVYTQENGLADVYTDYRDKVINALEAAGYDNADTLVEAWSKGAYNYQYMYDAVEAGEDPASAVADMLAGGYSESSVQSNLTSHFGDVYRELYKTDPAAAKALREHLIIAYVAAGQKAVGKKTATQSAADRVDKWVKDAA